MTSYFHDVHIFPVETMCFTRKSCDNQLEAKSEALGLARSALAPEKVGLYTDFHDLNLLRDFQFFHECPIFRPSATSCFRTEASREPWNSSSPSRTHLWNQGAGR